MGAQIREVMKETFHNENEMVYNKWVCQKGGKKEKHSLM